MSRVRRVVVGALVAVSVSACSGGGSGGASTSASLPEPSMTMYPSEPNSPTTTPSGSASMTATPTGTATTTASASAAATASIPEPVLPAEAKAHTPDGAAAFARHYMDVVSFAWMKPQTGAISSLSQDGCATCASLESGAKDFVGTKSRAASAPFSTTSAAPGAIVDQRQTVVLIAQQHQYQLNSEAGLSPAKSPEMRLPLMFHLEYTSAGWRARAIERIQQ